MSKPIFISFFLVAVLMSTNGRCQEITLNREKATLQDLFLDIHQQSGYFFYYANQDLAGANPVTVHVSKAPLNEVLDLCFAGQPLVYHVNDHTIVVQKKPVLNEAPIDAKGKVLNEQGEPMENVSVQVQGTRKITSTNGDGEFTLENIPEESILVFSHVGYATQTLSLHHQPFLTVILKRSLSKLDEVQVIAYGTTTRRLNTGDVSSINSDDIQKQPVTDPLSALEGRVSGLSVIQKTGVTGSGFQVLIRGQNSLTSGTDPLYIVDGVPFPSTPMGSVFSGIIQRGDPLSAIDPASISSIEILKDADATAIYGSRGANGVILITTKKGLAGKTRLDISAYTGIMKLNQHMKLLSGPEYLQMRREAFQNDNVLPNASNAPDLFVWDTTRSTNWQKLLLGGTGQINDIHAALDGGDSLTNFRVGGGYHEESSIFPGNFVDRKGAAQANLRHRSSNSRFYLQLSGNYFTEKNHLPGSDLTFQALTLPPDAPKLFDSLGNLNWEHSTWSNPLRLTRTFFEASTENALANMVLSYHLLSNLEIKLSSGYTRMNLREISTYPTSSNDPALDIQNGSSYFTSNQTGTWILEPQLNWQKSFGPGNLQLLLGSTFQMSSQINQTLNAGGYSNDDLLENIAGASSITVYNAQEVEYKYQAFFARILYNIKNQLIIDLTGRRDGSSRFGPGKQFAIFGAAGASWIFSKQSFFQKNLPIMTFGKLRTSWGVTGNDQIGDYQYLSTYSPTSYPYDNSSGLFPNNLSNPDYSWEKNTKWEGALETGWFRDRFLINVDYYLNRSSNQLVGYALPLLTGFSSIVANLPATIQNSGWEFEVNTRNFQSRSFTWTSSLNLSIPNDKLLAYPGLAGSSYVHRYVIGKSLGVVQAFRAAGVNAQTGVYQFLDSADNLTYKPRYPQDLQTGKAVRQQWYGGIENSFQFKGWRLDIFFQFVKQTGRNYLSSGYTAPGTLGNQPEIVTQRWQKPGDQATIQQYTQNAGSMAYSAFNTTYQYGDNAIGDASFISLKNLSLSYTLPVSVRDKYSITSAKIFIQGQNLLVINHYAGLSPQTQSFASLPLLMIVTGGLQLTF